MLLNALFKKLCPDGQALRKTARMMKIVTLFLLAGCLQLSARTAAQTISLTLTNATLSTAFTEIQRQSDYRFVFTNEQLAGASRVSIKVENATLEKVLELCFRDQPLDYNIEDKFIVVKPKEKKIELLTPVDNEIRGKVSNEKGEVIVGATIILKGKQRGTTTDGKGEFTMQDVPAGSLIIVSHIGLESQEIVITTNRNLVIHLQTIVDALDETIIKGYYSTSKRLNTGSVGKISGAVLQQQPVTNPLLGLAGRLPGLYVAQANGFAGSGVSVNIRGLNSISGGNEPLYIVDGMPFISGSLASVYTSSIIAGGNPLSSLNLADIESVEVLKDADATAIYGSRGSNGVILITTRKGKNGKIKLDVNFYSGLGKVTRTMRLLNTTQYLEVRKEAFSNDHQTPSLATAPDLLLWDTTRNTDWQKMAYGGHAAVMDGQVALSGGNSNTQFLFGAGYHRESPVVPGNFSDKKGSFHLHLSTASDNQKFKLNFTGSYLLESNRLPSVDNTRYILNLPPNAPAIYNPDGSLDWQDGFVNPFAYLLASYKANTEQLVTNVMATYQLLPGLELKSNLGYTKINLNEVSINPKSSFNPAYNPVSGYSDFASSSYKSWIIEPQLQYSRGLGNYGSISLLGGVTFLENIRQGTTIEANGFSSDALLENAAAGSSIKVFNANYTQYRYNALFGRFNYNLGDKYLLNLTARRDGSSRFGPGRQFANFGAIGVGWIFSRERIIHDKLPMLSFGKLRASFGTTGNDQIADYGYLSLWAPTQYAYQTNPGLSVNRLANDDYGWERNKKLEIALELGFWKDRVLLNANYYQNRADNQLVGYPLPAITGQNSVQANLPAIVQNKGLELECNVTVVKRPKFTWFTSVNASLPKNELVAYPGLSSSTLQNTYVVGKSLYVKKLFHSLGVDSKTGIYQFQDITGNGIGTDLPGDFQGLKEVTQRFFGGILNSVQYKSWKLDFLFQFVKQEGYNYLFSYFGVPGTFGNQPVAVLERWRQPGDNSNIQQFTQDFTPARTAHNNAASYSDMRISDASFIRFKNVSISFEFPDKWKHSLHITRGNVFVLGQNLLTITSYKGIDPESQNLSSIAPLKVVTAGFKLTL